jgi:hypothetical protein
MPWLQPDTVVAGLLPLPPPHGTVDAARILNQRGLLRPFVPGVAFWADEHPRPRHLGSEHSAARFPHTYVDPRTARPEVRLRLVPVVIVCLSRYTIWPLRLRSSRFACSVSVACMSAGSRIDSFTSGASGMSGVCHHAPLSPQFRVKAGPPGVASSERPLSPTLKLAATDLRED